MINFNLKKLINEFKINNLNKHILWFTVAWIGKTACQKNFMKNL